MVAPEAAKTIYRGYRDSSGQGPQFVTKDDDLLMTGPSQKVWNHSSDFNWGYGGSGPAQLALAILLDVTGDEDLASRHHQAFKREFVARWHDCWAITTGQVQEWLNGGVDGILRT